MNAVRRYANFSIFAGITLALTIALSFVLHPARALLASFDVGAVVFIVLSIVRFGRGTTEAMRTRAADNEPDHHVLIGMALVILAVVMTAVWVELSGSGGRHGTGIALAGATLVLSWLFANMLFAQHYAHIWYLKDKKGDARGLEFPGVDPTPDYWDFAYFAFVLGMTFQVSDVQVTTQRMRRLALFHGLLAFFFNIGVVALSVSLVASALAG